MATIKPVDQKKGETYDTAKIKPSEISKHGFTVKIKNNKNNEKAKGDKK